MRTRDEINKDIADRVGLLEKLIETSINEEQKNEERRNEVENDIENFKKEASFDDTLSGQVCNLMQDAAKKVEILLYELKQKTGVDLVAVFKLRNESKGWHGLTEALKQGKVEMPNVNLLHADLMKPFHRYSGFPLTGS